MGMVKTKPSHPPKGNKLNKFTDGNKGQAPSPMSTEVIRLEKNPRYRYQSQY